MSHPRKRAVMRVCGKLYVAPACIRDVNNCFQTRTDLMSRCKTALLESSKGRESGQRNCCLKIDRYALRRMAIAACTRRSISLIYICPGGSATLHEVNYRE